jgi:hypothetical protein
MADYYEVAVMVYEASVVTFQEIGNSGIRCKSGAVEVLAGSSVDEMEPQ